MASSTSQNVKNLLVPAFSKPRCLYLNFPQAPNNTIDFNQVTIDQVVFLPQAVVVDASAVPATEFVTFRVETIGFVRIIKGGLQETFNFPAVENLRISVNPSDGTSTVRCFFYDFPAFPDRSGSEFVQLLNSTVAITSTPGPTATNRQTVNSVVENAAIPAVSINLATTSPTQTIILHSLRMIFNGFSSVNNRVSVFGTTAGFPGSLLSIILPATSPTYTTQYVDFTPQVPLRLPQGDDLVWSFALISTLTGGLSVQADFEIV